MRNKSGGMQGQTEMSLKKKKRKCKAIKSKLDVIGHWLDEKYHCHKIILKFWVLWS